MRSSLPQVRRHGPDKPLARSHFGAPAPKRATPWSTRKTDAPGSRRSNPSAGWRGRSVFPPRRYGSDPGPPQYKLRAGRVLRRYGSVPNPPGRGLGAAYGVAIRHVLACVGKSSRARSARDT